ncbi:chorismate binding enzyme [compost metagenome]
MGEEALCLVAIRNMQWNGQFAMIGSGCGVVAASELEREWRELYQKRLSVKKILGFEL